MNTRYVWFAFGIGAALGSAAALLFAPQTGAATRKQLGDALDDATKEASTYAGDAGDYLKEQAGKLTAEAQKTYKQASDAAVELAGVATDVVQKSVAQTKAATSSIF